jgi:chlorite dismutase
LVSQRNEILDSRDATIEQISKASQDSIRSINASETEKLKSEVKLLTLRNQKASEDIKLLQNDLTRQRNDYEIKLKQLSSQIQYSNSNVQVPDNSRSQYSNADAER